MKKFVVVLVVLGIVLCMPYASHAVLVTYTLKQIDYPLKEDYTGAWEYNFSMQNDTPGDIHSMYFTLLDYNPSDPSGSRMWPMISYVGLPEPWGTNNLGEAWVFDSFDDQFVHGDYSAFPGYTGQDDDLHPGQTWNFSVSCFSYAGLIPGPLNFSVTFHSVPYSEDNHTHGSRTGQTIPASPVPEPATMLLLGTGFLVFAGFGKKLKK
jgi:hypothetical protein